jgi:hypothetical protein
MSEYEKFYKESLYPFQDGILNIVKRIDVPFYLTGGTALSRHYSPVRYSDDLDFFVNRDSEFSIWAERLYAELEMDSRRGSFTILSDRVMRFENYVQLFVQQQSRHNQMVIMKVDLVNDVAPHYGSIEWDDTLGRVDSWQNILSNKVSALYRVEAKDAIDLWTLARIKTFNWAEVLREASSKEAGLDPVVLYDLLKSFPREELSAIKWIDPRPNEEIILGDLSIMADEIFTGQENSLVVKGRR